MVARMRMRARTSAGSAQLDVDLVLVYADTPTRSGSRGAAQTLNRKLITSPS